MQVAVIGATGLVGQEVLRVLAERQFPLQVSLPVASTNATGQPLSLGWPTP